MRGFTKVNQILSNLETEEDDDDQFFSAKTFKPGELDDIYNAQASLSEEKYMKLLKESKALVTELNQIGEEKVFK